MTIKNIDLVPGYYYHIYNKAVEGNLLFRDDRNYHFFIDKIKKYLLRSADILVYCLMPNHYHFLLKITSDDFSKAMHKLALSYVVAFNRMYTRKGRLFASPYQRIHVQDPNYLLHLSRYIHINPVLAGLVDEPQDWPYSSYREYIGEDQTEFAKTDYILDHLSPDLYSTYEDQYSIYRKYVENWPEKK